MAREAERAREVLGGILQRMGIDATIDVTLGSDTEIGLSPEAEAAAVVMARTWVDSHVRNDPSD